jgi:hypothetical protein
MDIMKSYGVKTPECYVASSPEEAEEIYMKEFNKRKSFHAGGCGLVWYSAVWFR